MITAINLNHIKSNTRPSARSVLLLLLGCVFASLLCWHYLSIQRQISTLEIELQQKTQPKSVTKSTKDALDSAKDDAQSQAKHRVWAEINIPWTALFKALEAASHEKIKLLSFEPHTNTRQVRIMAIAFNVDDMMAYVNRLAAQPTLRQVRISSHEAKDLNGTSAIVFHVEAQWQKQ